MQHSKWLSEYSFAFEMKIIFKSIFLFRGTEEIKLSYKCNIFTPKLHVDRAGPRV